jgi:hypothetical protein
MRLHTVFVCLILFTAVKSLEKARYDNYRVYEISVDNDNQLELLKSIEDNPDGVRYFSKLKTIFKV